MNPATPQAFALVRTLPFPSAQLYLEVNDATTGALWPRLAACSLKERLSLWQRLSGAGVRPASKIWHLLYLHRRAFEAEMLGVRHRADFYWRDLGRRLRRVWDDSAAWDAAAAQVCCSGVDGAALRHICMDELFLDCHIALAHGLIRAGAPYAAARLALHLGAVERLLRLRAAPEDHIVMVLHPLVATEVAGLLAADMNAAALARLRGIKVLALKHKFATILADLVFRNLMAEMERKPEPVQSSQIGLVANAINEIEVLRIARPGIAVLYQLLGVLHHIQSVQMANADLLADALVSCEKARTYWPPLDNVEETRQALHAKMIELRKFIDKLEREAGGVGGRTLTAAGQHLKAEAERGFMPLQIYIDSAARSDVIAARDTMLARDADEAEPDEAPAAGIDQRLCVHPVPQRPEKLWSKAVWSFAVQDGRSQAMLAGALAFNLIVGVITAVELYQRGERDDAIAALRAPGLSDEQVIALSVRFLRAQTPGFRDPRRVEVSEAYARAFTRWFESVVNSAELDTSPRIAEYRQLGIQGEQP